MPKIVDHNDYRREMLDKCFGLFSEKGYANITMKDIAAEIGVSTGTLYHYFSTKESILKQLISRAGEINTTEYVRRSDSTGTVSERFSLMVNFWKENGEFYRNLMMLGIDMKRALEPQDSEQVFNEFSELYTTIMSERLNISMEYARFIFVYLLGLVLHSLLTPGKINYEEEIDRFSDEIEPFIKERPYA
jgi:AcrR family transcriptional regulator